MSPGGRVLGYLASAQNLLGCTLGAGAAAATLLSGAAGPLWPVVVAASYGIGAAAGALLPRRSGVLALDAAGGDGQEVLDAVARARERRAPKELAGRVAAVLDTVAEIAPRWASVSTDPQVAHDVTATLSDYLPSTLDAYAAIPEYLRQRREPGGSESPREDAEAQLDLLLHRMRQIRDAAFAGDLQRLQAQGQFLDQRFNPPASGLDLGTTQP